MNQSRSQTNRKRSGQNRNVAPYGDRRQEIVVIGRDVDEAELRQRFDACLLDDDELALGVEGWQGFQDDLAPWLADDEEVDADGVAEPAPS